MTSIANSPHMDPLDVLPPAFGQGQFPFEWTALHSSQIFRRRPSLVIRSNMVLPPPRLIRSA